MRAAFDLVDTSPGMQVRERSLVELMVSDELQKGRVYGITDRGAAALKAIESHRRYQRS